MCYKYTIIAASNVTRDSFRGDRQTTQHTHKRARSTCPVSCLSLCHFHMVESLKNRPRTTFHTHRTCSRSILYCTLKTENAEEYAWSSFSPPGGHRLMGGASADDVALDGCQKKKKIDEVGHCFINIILCTTYMHRLLVILWSVDLAHRRQIWSPRQYLQCRSAI